MAQVLSLLCFGLICHRHLCTGVYAQRCPGCISVTSNRRCSLGFIPSFPKLHYDISTELYATKKLNRPLPSIPVIGPIINENPLNIGSDMILDPPTPLQWKALQESVVEHSNHNKMRKESIDEEHEKSMKTGTIDAAPIIAIIDDWTKDTPVCPQNSPFNKGGRYATLAAVVGITRRKTIDSESDDEERFMDYAESIDKDGTIIPLRSSIRLVGIGRAALRDFFYRVPTDLEGSDEVEKEADSDYEFDYNDGYEDKTPIVMAQFEPLVDDASIYSNTDPNAIGNKGVRSYRSSPVHAISELYKLARRVEWLHEDRRKLVAGLNAAKIRLERRREETRGEELIDHDGLGALYESTTGMTVEALLDRFEGKGGSKSTILSPDTKSKLERLENLENYGLPYHSLFSSIGDLTKVTATLLRPYYSQRFRDREEFLGEVSSFIAFRTLEGFVTSEDLAEALRSTSSIERYERALGILIDHKMLLQTLAERVSNELRDCGEECTDLW